MNEDRWISTDARSSRIVIRFRVKGHKKQFHLATGLQDNPANREIVRQRRDLIAGDIALGAFDPTLAKYQFTTRITVPAEVSIKNRYQLDLAELWEKFTEFKKAILEQTTILATYRATERYIAKLPTTKLDKAALIRDWLLKNTTHLMAWQLIVRFSECCEWGVSSGMIEDNPFQNLKIKKPKKRSTSEDYRAYTLEQRDLIIEAFTQHDRYCHYASLIKFLFWTGCRLGEAFALTWGDIQSNCTRIHITKSCNLYGVKKGTKNGKRRVFPTVEGSKLQTLLLSIKPPPESYRPNDLIFRSLKGRQLNSELLQNVWNSYSVNTGKKLHFYPGVVRTLAAEGYLPYLKPYSTRHTCATWAIALGETPDRVALWIGDEVNTVLKYYCHPNIVNAVCPDF